VDWLLSGAGIGIRAVLRSVVVLLSALSLALPSVAIAGPSGPSAQDKKVKKQKKEEFFYEYEVQDGDTLSLIAKRYDTSVSRLIRWNRKATKNPKSLKVGAVLRIYTEVPIRQKRKVYYVVQKGDSLSRIARKVGVSRNSLRELNGLKRDRLKPGQRLVYVVPGPEKPSESIGRPSDGRLVNGEKMPAGPGYSYGSRPNVYAANDTVTLLIQGFGQFRKKHPDAPLIIVGNMSRPDGGRLPPHKSHQSGRDVDLGYLHKVKFQPVTNMLTTDEGNLDPKLTWALLETFLATNRVKAIFIDYKIQKALHEYLTKKKYSKRKLEKLFQYPRGRGAEALIKHVKGHHHHIHLRFTCPRTDSRCED